MNRGKATTTTEDPGLKRDAEALHAAMSELVRIYQLRDRNQICCYDISVTQCYALEALTAGGPLRLGELAERLHLDKSTTSRVVQTLVRKGYVEHAPDASDKRAIVIAATRPGRRLYERITQELIEQQQLVVQDMDPQVRQAVVEVIRRVARAAAARFCGSASGTDTNASCCSPIYEDA